MQLADMNQEGLFNVLLEWGKSHILSPGITSYLKRLEEYCKPFIQDDNLESFLLHSIEELKKQTGNAISVLSNIELVFVTEDDNMALWHEAENAFFVLDEVNYLMEAVHFLVAPYKDDVYKKTVLELDKIFSSITAWLEEGGFSPMRFVAMNDFRQERLSSIPEENKYRFPWYEDYSDYAENTLGTLILYWDEFLSKNWKRLDLEIPGEHLIEIWYELKRDKQLLSLVKREASLQKALFEAVSVPSAVKLLGLRSDESLDYILPECVEDAGVIRVCGNLLSDAIAEISSEAEKSFWIYLTAFCGPSFDDKQRLELFNTVEDRIHKIDITEISREKRDLLERLKSWFKGKCEDSDLVKASFDAWLKLIEQKASHMMASEIDAEPNELRIAVNNIVNKEIQLHISEPRITIFNPVEAKRNERKNSKLLPVYLKYPHAIAAGSREKKVTMLELKIEKNPIYFSLRPDAGGMYYIIPLPDKVIDCNAIEEYRKLWNMFKDVKGDNMYAGGIYIKEDGQIEDIQIKTIKKRFFETPEIEKGFRNAIIAISNEKTQIEEFIQEFKKSFVWSGKEKVIVLDIWLEKES